IRRVQPRQDGSVRAQERTMPRGPVSRAARRLTGRRRREGWPRRFWRELGAIVPEHDAGVRLIILERLVESAGPVSLAISRAAPARLGSLARLSEELQEQLNLAAGHGVITRALTWAVTELGHLLPHVTVLALGALLYAALETTEGIGLARRRRWAE